MTQAKVPPVKLEEILGDDLKDLLGEAQDVEAQAVTLARSLFSSDEIDAAQGADAKDAALTVLSWAKENRLFSQHAAEVAAEAVEDKAVLEPQQLFSKNSVQEVFRKKPINLICYNELDKKVVVFTRSKLTAAEQKLVPVQAVPGYSIEYSVGGSAGVKGDPPPPQRHFPYHLHGGRYACGSSVFPANCIGAGTFGLLVSDAAGKMFGLTNNHVTGACNNAPPGLPILAPGPLDVSHEHANPFTIGRHYSLLPINDGIPENVDINSNCDAACFEILDEDLVSSSQGGRYDTPAVVAEPVPGRKVSKVGRTTGFTEGRIVGQAVCPVPVSYSVSEYGVKKEVFFADVYVVQGLTEIFSKPGDSGSLVVQIEPDGSVTSVGLVFAGNARGESFVLPLSKILKDMNLSVVSGHNI